MYRRASGADAASSASVAGVVVGSVAARMLSGMSAGGAEAFGVDGPGWVGSGAGAPACAGSDVVGPMAGAVCQGCGCAVCHGRGGRVVVGPEVTGRPTVSRTPAAATITTRAIGTTLSLIHI